MIANTYVIGATSVIYDIESACTVGHFIEAKVHDDD